MLSITSAGHLLAFPISELPELDKGKGNKLIQIPPAKLKSGEEKVIANDIFRERVTLRGLDLRLSRRSGVITRKPGLSSSCRCR